MQQYFRIVWKSLLHQAIFAALESIPLFGVVFVAEEEAVSEVGHALRVQREEGHEQRRLQEVHNCQSNGAEYAKRAKSWEGLKIERFCTFLRLKAQF